MGFLVTKAEVHSITLSSKGFSTLGGRDVWLDRDVMRLNYDRRGEYLGSFHARDRLLIIRESGECYTTDFDADAGCDYIKRFMIDPEQKRENILGENPQNRFLILTDTYYPRLALGRKERSGEIRMSELDVETFALVKGIRAKGKRLANYPVVELSELPPLKESPIIEDEGPNTSTEEGEEDLFAPSDFSPEEDNATQQ